MGEGVVKIRITGDDSQFDGVVSGLDNKVGKIGSIMQGIGQSIGQGLANAPAKIGSLLNGAVDKASDLNETMSKTGVIFGQDALPGLEKWASTADKALGQSKQQALDAASTFAVFGKSAGLSGEDLSGFSTNLVGLAGDLASFHNASPEDAIQAIGAALRGEAEPMRRYGVLLDDATMRQKALELGIVQTTKEALTPQQKVLAAQALILEQTKDAQGDFARTSDGLANRQRILKAEWENMQTTVGQKLLPVMLNLMKFFMDDLVPGIGKVIEVVKQVSQFFMEHKEILIGVAAGITVALLPSIIAYTAIMASAAVATLAAAAPFIAIAAVIAALVAGVIWAYQNWDWFRIAVDAAVDGIVFAAKLLWQGIKLAVDVIVTVIGTLISWFNVAWDTANSVVDKIVGVFKGMPGALSGALSGVVDFITSPFREAFNAIARLWNNTIGRLSFSFPDWVPGLGGKGFDVPDIPTFARGGFAPKPMIAVVGDNTDGSGEHIVGDSKLRQVIREEQSGGINIGTIVLGRGGPRELSSELDWMLRIGSR